MRRTCSEPCCCCDSISSDGPLELPLLPLLPLPPPQLLLPPLLLGTPMLLSVICRWEGRGAPREHTQEPRNDNDDEGRKEGRKGGRKEGR